MIKPNKLSKIILKEREYFLQKKQDIGFCKQSLHLFDVVKKMHFLYFVLRNHWAV